ncbi:MAG TPA: ABC transporter substrate-binding protein [Chloroflexota bacterium]
MLTCLLMGCAPAPAGSVSPATAPSNTVAIDRPLVIFVGVEPSTVATRGLVQKGAGLHAALRIFNALPALVDDKGIPRPELLASLPALNTDTWQVFPDGTMQTTYTLRPNLTWHDGAELTSDDFVFSWHVYSSPDLGIAGQAPMSLMSDLQAVDREHFQIHWKQPYADAETLSLYNSELPALPKHLMGAAFDQIATSGGDVFATNSFWGPQYVGAGPYRMQQWETGGFVEGIGFDKYPLGAPKISRVRLRFGNDQNVVMANLLSGDAHVATDSSIAQAAEELRAQWAQSKAGSVFRWPNAWHSTTFQLRPEVANPRAVLDLRVRKAIAHSIDKQGISEAVYAGQGIIADTPIWVGSAWGAALDDSIATYAFDPRATETLMTEAGYKKGGDGVYSGPGGRLSLDLGTSQNPDFVREILVMADGFGNAGFEIQQRVVPSALAQDGQLRASFPALFTSNTNLGESALNYMAIKQIPSQANRWVGGNRGGWVSPEFDRLLATFNMTLDREGRLQLVRQMLRVHAADLQSVSLFFSAQPFAYVNSLKGPANAVPESNLTWNVHEWEWTA